MHYYPRRAPWAPAPSRLAPLVVSLGMVAAFGGCADPASPDELARVNRPSFVAFSGGGGIPNGGMEGTSASGTYSQWPPSGWGMLGLAEGYGEKGPPCYTTGWCNSGTVTSQWGNLTAPPNPDPIGRFQGFAVLATHDVLDALSNEIPPPRRYVIKGAVSVGLTVPLGRSILAFDWAFLTSELNTGPNFNDVARVVFEHNNTSEPLLEVSRNDLQPGGSGNVFSSMVPTNAGGNPQTCGSVGSGILAAEYALCTRWQHKQIDMSAFAGAQGRILITVEETPNNEIDQITGRAFEADPHPSAFAFDNFRFHTPTTVGVEGVQVTPSVTFQPLGSQETVLSVEWNVPGCSAPVVQNPTVDVSNAAVVCPDDGDYEFSARRISSGSHQCDPDLQVCGPGVFDDDTVRVYGLLQVNNAAPSATFTAPAAVDEGQNYTLALSSPVDVAADIPGLEYRFDCGDGADFGGWSPIANRSCPATTPGVRTVRGQVRDNDLAASTIYTGSVTINNLGPTITSITGAPPDPIPLNTSITLTTAFTPGQPGDVHSALVTWDDGTTSLLGPPVVTGFQASHTFTAAGVYTIPVRVTDDDNSSDTRTTPNYVVVYDPSAGFVTGGGWIVSPPGAQLANPSATGTARFGFSAKYTKNGAGPAGATEFDFTAGNLSFASTSYQWLVVAGSKAQFKGNGTINGTGTFGFLLTAIDGKLTGGDGIDKFRIKIWNVGTNALVYDNKAGEPEDSNAATPLGGGNIMVHTKK